MEEMGKGIELCRQLGKKSNKIVTFVTFSHGNEGLNQLYREGLDHNFRCCCPVIAC